MDNEQNGMNEELDNIVILNDENGEEYVVLLPADDETSDEVVILKVEDTDSDDEESYVSVEDEDILNTVFNMFKEKFKDEFDFVDED